ncbi:MAG: hypothetical protein ABEL76_17300, partial [Bradymonadaceae bacterium]
SVVYYTVVELGLGLIPTVEIFTVRFHLQNVAGLSEGSPTVLTGLFPDSGFTLEWWTSALLLGLGCSLAVALGGTIFEWRRYEV